MSGHSGGAQETSRPQTAEVSWAHTLRFDEPIYDVV